jgi:chaperonin GroEL (HSP60 family)
VVITNDGATILKHMAVLHPAARMVGHSPETKDSSEEELTGSW